jgi:hypothetical protein
MSLKETDKSKLSSLLPNFVSQHHVHIREDLYQKETEGRREVSIPI